MNLNDMQKFPLNDNMCFFDNFLGMVEFRLSQQKGLLYSFSWIHDFPWAIDPPIAVKMQN